MSNGWMKTNASGEPYGRIMTMKNDFEFKLKRIVSENPKAPAYEVLTKSASGAYLKVGVVFEKRTKEKTDDMTGQVIGGEPFYSFSIDDPSFDDVLYVTAFGAKERPGEFDIVWQRPRPKAEAA